MNYNFTLRKTEDTGIEFLVSDTSGLSFHLLQFFLILFLMLLFLNIPHCNNSSLFINEVFYHSGLKFTIEEFTIEEFTIENSEISAHSINFCLNKLLSALIKTAFFKSNARVFFSHFVIHLPIISLINIFVYHISFYIYFSSFHSKKGNRATNMQGERI